MRYVALAAGMLLGCGSSHHGLPDAPPGTGFDAFGVVDTLIDGAATDGSVTSDGTIAADSNLTTDGTIVADAGLTPDSTVTPDAVIADAAIALDAAVGIITGGPCLSGTPGAAGYRIRWANGGGTAYPVYEVDGLPDHSRDKAGAYGYSIPFTASFVDPFLGEGGLQLDDSDFVDLEITTVGISQIAKATLSIYGRSYNVDTSGSFNWQTFHGTGSTATNFVSNVAPYAWYSADMTSEITPGDGGVLIRIKAGPGSDALVVNRIELCLSAT